MGSVFNTLGFSYLSYTPNSNLLNKLSIKQRINDIQLQEQNRRLKNSKKLNILTKFYRAGIRPYHVDILKNKNKRTVFSKLRISAHKLAIECDRYLKIPKRVRICTACNNCAEQNEAHF